MHMNWHGSDYKATLLGLGSVFISEVGDFQVERYHTPKTPDRREATVIFSTPNTRDAVRGAGINLAGSAAGMNIHVPVHLRANFRHLDNLCFELKKRYPSLKRSVKFDDDALDLFADVKLSDNHDWGRFTPQKAREAKIELVNSGQATTGGGTREFSAQDLSGFLAGKSPSSS